MTRSAESAGRRGMAARRTPSVERVADGVYRLQKAAVNCYLVVDGDGMVLIDAGLPRSWRVLRSTLDEIGSTPDAISAVLLTHGHFDHVGMCDRLRWEHHVTTHVHENDHELARHPYRYAHESARSGYPFRHPAAVPLLMRMAAAGALWVKGVSARPDVRPGVPLDLPGGLTPVFSPGHTAGHCGYFMPSRGILFSGDALVTLDPYTARTGPRVSKPTTSWGSTISAPKRETWATARWVRSEPVSPLGKPR